MSAELEPLSTDPENKTRLSTESYTLADFSHEDWMLRPEYCQYQGVAIEHLKHLHRDAELHICDEHIAFVETDAWQCFTIWLYDIVTWDHTLAVRTVQPSFRVLGRTWEGVTEVQACPADAPPPDVIIAQMQWTLEFIDSKGWKEA